MSKMSQTDYIAILFVDLNMGTRMRKAWLKAEFGKERADELTITQCSMCIDRLKEMKEGARLRDQVLEEEEEF